jgi:hypothetical protein
MNPDLPFGPVATAAELCSQLTLDPSARRLLQPEQSPAGFLNVLTQQRKYADAIRVIGAALPARKAVWWACICARHAANRLRDEEHEALASAVRWVVEPGDATALAAKEAATRAGAAAPAGAAALAAARAKRRPIAAAKVSAGAVLTAAARVQGTSLPDAYRQCIALALEINALPAPWQRPA